MKLGCVLAVSVAMACTKQSSVADSAAPAEAIGAKPRRADIGSFAAVGVAGEAVSLAVPSESEVSSESSAGGAVAERRGLELPRLFSALSELEAGQQAEPVRIAWFGDSHTAADFLTGELRQELQARFGDGGPGFVHVGVGNTRHDDVRCSQSGRWQRLPSSPTAYYLQEDGMFGISGMRARVESGSALLRCPGQIDATLWEVVVRPTGARARLSLVAPGEDTAHVEFANKDSHPAIARRRGSQLFGVTYRVPASTELQVQARSLDVFGAFGETQTPGLVLDVMGINGARARTMLAWHEGAWLGELSERAPRLVVLAYGSNEAGDGALVESYVEDYHNVMERVSAALPEADCLLVGPTDRGPGQELQARRAAQIDELQRRVSAELGCAYFSLYEEMGGAGGFSRWARAEPTLASADGVHLTQEGYRRLGRLLAGRLLSSYRAWAASL